MRLSGQGGFLSLEHMAPRDRRAVLLGLAVLVPAFAWVLGVKPYRATLAELDDRVSMERDALMRERELLASSGSLLQELEGASRVAGELQKRLVQGSNPILAEDVLTDFLEEAAVRNRVLLEEIRSGELARGEESPPGLDLIRLHLRGESDMEGVLSFLDGIERSGLLLRVRGLALEPELARVDSEEGEDNAPRPSLPTGVVNFQLIVDGFASLTEQES